MLHSRSRNNVASDAFPGAAIGLAAGALGAVLLYRQVRGGRENEAPASKASTKEQGDPLSTYVHDHLSGAVMALEVLERLREDHQGERLARFAGELLEEIETDRDTLRELARRLGGGQNLLKEATSWLGARATELKLGRSTAGDFGSLQALEVVALGIQGKLALWRALGAVSPRDPRLKGFDLEDLADRADEQYSEVEDWRLAMAKSVFGRKKK